MKRGCKQSFEFQHKYYDLEGNEQWEKRKVELTIEPKTKSGTKLVVHRIGSAQAGRIPADLVVTVKHAKAEKFLKKKLAGVFS